MATDELTPALFRFNFHPVSYCHPSWWNIVDLPANISARMAHDPVAASMLSRKMLLEHQIAGQVDMDFVLPFRRIALLPYQRQKRIIYQLGLAVYRERLAKMIASDKQAQLQTIFGRDDCFLALRLRIDHKFTSAEFLPVLPVGNKLRCRNHIYLAGLSILTNVVNSEAVGFYRRFYFTWPKSLVIRRLAARERIRRQDSKALAQLEDHVLYCCRHLSDPAVTEHGRKLLGQLLSLQGY